MGEQRLEIGERLEFLFQEDEIDEKLNPLVKHDSRGNIEFDGEDCYEVVDGVRKRKICGAITGSGDYCRQSAGNNTVTHKGSGPCLTHSSQKDEENFINKLQSILGTGNTMGDLMQRVDTITEIDMKSVDSEIKLLYALVMNIFNSLKDKDKISVDEEKRLRILAREIRDTKLVRGRLQNLTKVDAAYVAYIFDKMALILKRIVPENADQIMTTFLNLSRSPFNDILQSDIELNGNLLGGGDFEF